ncbi:hypothetical protein FRB93_002575 [Tulasnella sp. JGI-2019a]|nr:hypothetical protein FRB93_002575 [Tulasnella sp. JGI-2019a]
MFPLTRSYPGIAIFVNYVFQMIIVIAPMMIFSHISRPVVSQMHDINNSSTKHRREARVRPHDPLSMGAISTTIAFQPPLSHSVASESRATEVIGRRKDYHCETA